MRQQCEYQSQCPCHPSEPNIPTQTMRFVAPLSTALLLVAMASSECGNHEKGHGAHMHWGMNCWNESHVKASQMGHGMALDPQYVAVEAMMGTSKKRRRRDIGGNPEVSKVQESDLKKRHYKVPLLQTLVNIKKKKKYQKLMERLGNALHAKQRVQPVL